MQGQLLRRFEQLLPRYSHLPTEAQDLIRIGLIESWRQLSMTNFVRFNDEILGFTDAPFHKEWERVLGNRTLRRIVDAAPRGHSKSTKFSVSYPLWEIANNANVRILLVSAAESQSSSFLREIKGRIERDQTYIDFAGQLKPKNPSKWTDKEIILDRSRTDIKDPTISTVSVGGTILSKRVDIIICDDLLNFENTRTVEQRQKIRDWFNLVLLPVLEPKTGRLIVVGTIWQVGDLMEELLGDPTFDYRKRYKAIIKEPDRPEMWQQWYNLFVEEREDRKARANQYREENHAQMDEGLEVMWPERMPYEELYLLRQADAYAFARAYQNDPASRPSQMIKREWIERALARGKALKLQDEPHLNRDYIDTTTIGYDLAISQETSADDTAGVVIDRLGVDWGENKKGMYVIRNIKRGKMTFGETKALVTTDYYAIQPQGVRVETVGYQEALQRELADSSIPVRGHRTGSEKWDSAIGVNSIGILLENDRLIIPSDPRDARTKDLAGKLVSEMLAFPEGHTGDSLMALWFAYLESMEIYGSKYVIPSPQAVAKTPMPAVIPPPLTEREADLRIATETMQRRNTYWAGVDMSAIQRARDEAIRNAEWEAKNAG